MGIGLWVCRCYRNGSATEWRPSMTLTADTQAAPWMTGWTAPQAGATPADDPATEIDRLRSERDLARAERDRVDRRLRILQIPGRDRGRGGSPPARLVRRVRRDPGRAGPGPPRPPGGPGTRTDRLPRPTQPRRDRPRDRPTSRQCCSLSPRTRPSSSTSPPARPPLPDVRKGIRIKAG